MEIWSIQAEINDKINNIIVRSSPTNALKIQTKFIARGPDPNHLGDKTKIKIETQIKNPVLILDLTWNWHKINLAVDSRSKPQITGKVDIQDSGEQEPIPREEGAGDGEVDSDKES